MTTASGEGVVWRCVECGSEQRLTWRISGIPADQVNTQVIGCCMPDCDGEVRCLIDGIGDAA